MERNQAELNGDKWLDSILSNQKCQFIIIDDKCVIILCRNWRLKAQDGTVWHYRIKQLYFKNKTGLDILTKCYLLGREWVWKNNFGLDIGF